MFLNNFFYSGNDTESYRPDIDGLRGIAVIIVMAFHFYPELFKFGFIGVDIFFVISGYLVTKNISHLYSNKQFTFLSFYQRRVARLAPAYLATTTISTAIGFFTATPSFFERFGKELKYSAIGAVNFLNARGLDYFAQKSQLLPLHHLWSLGVEEQFYVVWPTVLLISLICDKRFQCGGSIFLVVTMLLIIGSVYCAIFMPQAATSSGYFNPWFRAHELLIGAIVGAGPVTLLRRYCSRSIDNSLACMASITMFLSIISLHNLVVFPGSRAILPCVSTTLLLFAGKNNIIGRLLSFKPLVFIGLISYPLYLFHQPLLALLLQGKFSVSGNICRLLSISLTLVLSVLTYYYLEYPIRSLVRNKNHASRWITSALIVGVITTGIVGLVISKTNGLSWRVRFLNPYLNTVIKKQEAAFSKYFPRGVKLQTNNFHPRVLFVGDSVLQQYVVPLVRAWRLEDSSVNTITRGGCILLPGTPFKDVVADVTHPTLINAIQNLEGKFDAIVISQLWEAYRTQSWRKAVNKNDNTFHDWREPIEKAIHFYRRLSDKIIIIGPHIKVMGMEKVQPSMSLTKESYASGIKSLFVQNQSELVKGKEFFKAISNELDCIIIYPEDIFRSKSGKYNLHDNTWSYFTDQWHVSEAATDYVEKQLGDLLKLNKIRQLTN